MKHLQPGQAGFAGQMERIKDACRRSRQVGLPLSVPLSWVVGPLARPLLPGKKGLVKCLEPMVTARSPTGPTKEAPELLQFSVLLQLSFLQNKQQLIHAGKFFFYL